MASGRAPTGPGLRAGGQASGGGREGALWGQIWAKERQPAWVPRALEDMSWGPRLIQELGCPRPHQSLIWCQGEGQHGAEGTPSICHAPGAAWRGKAGSPPRNLVAVLTPGRAPRPSQCHEWLVPWGTRPEEGQRGGEGRCGVPREGAVGMFWGVSCKGTPGFPPPAPVLGGSGQQRKA